MITIEDATSEHVNHIAPSLREADRLELSVASTNNQTDLESLQHCVDISYKCRTLLYKGEPFFVYGITKDGFVWAMGTDVIFDCKREFYVVSWEEVEWLQEDFDLIGNYVHSQNTLHINWLRKIGFKGFEPCEINKHKFYKFWRYKNV